MLGADAFRSCCESVATHRRLASIDPVSDSAGSGALVYWLIGALDLACVVRADRLSYQLPNRSVALLCWNAFFVQCRGIG
jgi:hypothetical protein